MNNSTSRTSYEQAAADHSRLLAGAEAVLNEWPHDAREATESRPYLVQALNELKSRLLQHFAAEETPEYLSEEVAAAPRLAARASELQQQHAKFTETLERLIVNVQNKAVDGDRLAGQREALTRLIRDLRQHEQAEDDLLLEAIEGDIGSGD